VDLSAPVNVVVRDGRVLVDGVEVARTDEIAKDGRLRKVDGLFDALRLRRVDHPDRSRKVVLDVQSDVPAVVVKSVFQTAAFAGYADIHFKTPDGGEVGPR